MIHRSCSNALKNGEGGLEFSEPIRPSRVLENRRTASETVTPSSHLASRDYQRALPGDGKSSQQERKGGLSAVLALMCQNVV